MTHRFCDCDTPQSADGCELCHGWIWMKTLLSFRSIILCGNHRRLNKLPIGTLSFFAEHNQVYLEYSCRFSGISNSFQWGRFACFSMLNGTARPRRKKVDCLTISMCAILSFYIAGYPCLPVRNVVSIFALTSKPMPAPNRNQPVTTL